MRYWRVHIRFRPPSARVPRRFWMLRPDSVHFATVGDYYNRQVLLSVNRPIGIVLDVVDNAVMHDLFNEEDEL